MLNNPLVSVVIPTYNRKNILKRLLKSLLRSSYKNLEVIIIDDASKDQTFEEIKKEYSANRRIKIYRNKKNLFAAGSKNVGLGKAKGKFIAFVDDDNVVDSRMIEELVKVLVDNQEVGEVGPINYNFNNKKSLLMARSTRSMWTTKTLHLRTLKPFGSKKYWETDDIPNAFMVRADVLKKFKIKFDSLYGIMYEESDFAYRIRRTGYKIFMVRNAKIYHDIEDATGENKKDYLYHFMEDSRRPFVFARNRVIFHSRFSSTAQKLTIFLFWIWLFTLYYFYKFILYEGQEKFSLKTKLIACLNYLNGTLVGLEKFLTYNR